MRIKQILWLLAARDEELQLQKKALKEAKKGRRRFRR